MPEGASRVRPAVDAVTCFRPPASLSNEVPSPASLLLSARRCAHAAAAYLALLCMETLMSVP